jgi:hypothetical protein
MIKIDEDQTTIRLTRGDATHSDYNRIAFYFPIWDAEAEEETKYEFQTTDKITFIVYETKGYTKRELLKIEKTLAELGYTAPTETPELQLTSEDTMVFPLENKKHTYNYEIILNDDTTILGSDDEGDKKIIVYPGGTQEDE